MAQFDVYRSPEGEYWLDCQADVLAALNSRFIVPLSRDRHDRADRRLNPRFTVSGTDVVMLTHLAAAVPTAVLSAPVASLIAHEYEIGAALDMLVSGF